MKKIILTFWTALLAIVSLQGQLTVILQGTVTDSIGPIGGVAVHIDSLRPGNPSGTIPGYPYQNVVYTDSSGNYTDTFLVPASVSAGALWVYIVNCKGDTISAIAVFGNSPGSTVTLINNFNYCPASTGSGNVYGLRGLVYTGNTLADFARVYLIEYDSAAGTLYAIDSMDLGSGAQGYWFNNLSTQNVLFVKAALLPASAVYSSYLPTYFDTVLWWHQAIPLTPVVMNPFMPGFDISMVAGNNPGGPGFIGGLVSQGANKTNGPGDPVVGASVLLLTQDDKPVTHTITNQNGEFQFSGIAYGSYKVFVEIAGKYCTPHLVTIDQQNPSSAGLQFKVKSTAITTGLFKDKMPTIEKVKIYPNPANSGEETIVDFGGETIKEATLWTIDGKEVYKWDSQELETTQQLKITPAMVQAGSYFLFLKNSEGALSISKILRSH